MDADIPAKGQLQQSKLDMVWTKAMYMETYVQI